MAFMDILPCKSDSLTGEEGGLAPAGSLTFKVEFINHFSVVNTLPISPVLIGVKLIKATKYAK